MGRPRAETRHRRSRRRPRCTGFPRRGRPATRRPSRDSPLSPEKSLLRRNFSRQSPTRSIHNAPDGNEPSAATRRCTKRRRSCASRAFLGPPKRSNGSCANSSAASGHASAILGSRRRIPPPFAMLCGGLRKRRPEMGWPGDKFSVSLKNKGNFLQLGTLRLQSRWVLT